MANVTRSGAFGATADEVWSVIGDFHRLAEWHPALERQTAEGDVRNHHVRGGGTIVERLIGEDERSYAYEIVSGPLPVENYRSVLAVAPAEGGSVVVWTSTFEPTADGAAKAIAGIYETGLSALTQRLPA